MRTSGHLARTPVRRRAAALGEATGGGGGGGVRRLGGRAGARSAGPGERVRLGGGAAGLHSGGGPGGPVRRAGVSVRPQRREPRAPKPRESRSAGAAGPGRAEGDHETDGWQEGGAPRPRAGPGPSYLFKRRPPPASPRSRGLTRRVVSEPPAAGTGSMSSRPRPSRPHRGGERWGRPLAKSKRPADPWTPRRAAGPPEWRELRRLWSGVSELQIPRPLEPRPEWGELPKPRLQASWPLPPA